MISTFCGPQSKEPSLAGDNSKGNPTGKDIHYILNHVKVWAVGQSDKQESLDEDLDDISSLTVSSH